MNSNDFTLDTSIYFKLNITKCEIYIAMKRIVHKEQSQRRVPENSRLAVKQWWKDSVRELWNRPRSSVQLKYGVFPALSEEERAMCRHLGTVLIRVVPPKPFGPL